MSDRPVWVSDCDALYIIAEAGVNHNGDEDRALELVDVAASSGADAVKFQTFTTSHLVTASAPKATYQVRNDNSATSQADMLSALELRETSWARIKRRCEERGIAFLSTPFDLESADFLESLGVSAFKVSSGDLTYPDLLVHLARKQLPIIISTGMATFAETAEAVNTITNTSEVPLGILHCVSDYPCQPEDANLLVIPALAAAFGKRVGWSDHTTGLATSIASVALGARLIEKHFTTDRSLPGPDHIASLEPGELRNFVSELRDAHAALGNGIKAPKASELETSHVARRSIVLLDDVRAGEILTHANCGARRPGYGLPPRNLPFLLGRRAGRDMEAGTVLVLADLV